MIEFPTEKISRLRAFWSSCLVAAAALSTAISCIGLRSQPDASVLAAAAPRARELREGVYEICDGAYAHVESVRLHNGTFQHFIQTHGMYGGRSSGTYTLSGDTLVVVIQQHALPEGAQVRLSLDYRFVAGEFAGYPVLWRGVFEARRMEAEQERFSPYSALFYTGPDSSRRQVPSCAAIRASRTPDSRASSGNGPQ